MNKDYPISAPVDGADESARIAAIARLHDLFCAGILSYDCFSSFLDQIFSAPSHTRLEAAMSALPSIITLTPASQRLTGPLVLRTADDDLQLGSGWQLAADTSISTGIGAARLDLTAASWDADQIHLRLQTWGSMAVLIPRGVAVQVVGGSGRLQLESLAPSFPGGPLLRISISGPTGVIRICHPTEGNSAPSTRWRRRRRAVRSCSRRKRPLPVRRS